MKRKTLLLMLLLALIAPWTANAQNQLNEGFEGTTFPPDDWTAIHVSGSQSWKRSTGTGNNSSSAFALRKDVSGGYEDYLITPKLVPATGEELSFYLASQYAYSYSGTTLTIEVSTTTPEIASFTDVIATYNSGASGNFGSSGLSDWVNKTVDVSAYVGQQIYIAFHAKDSGYNADVRIDDVSGVSIFVAACPKPTDLTSNVTSNLATLSWTSDAGSWNLKYKAADETNYTEVTGLSASSYQLSVTPNTTYQWMVQAVCSGTPGEYTSPASFTTPCEAFALPYSYGFEDADELSCWEVIKTSSSTGIVSATDAPEGSNVFRFYYNEHNAFLASPVFSGTEQGLAVTFQYMNSSNSTSYIEQFQVGYTTNASAALADFTYGETIYAENEWVTYENTFPANTKRIAIKYIYTDGMYLRLDDFNFETASSCPRPVNLAASNPGSRSVELSWTEKGEATAWQICVNGDEANLVDVDTNPYTLTGLTPETEYTVKVRANCGGEQSAWSQGANFSTLVACPAPTGLTVSDIDVVSANVSWTSNTNVDLRYVANPNYFFQGFVTDPGAMSDGSDASWTKSEQSTLGPGAQHSNGTKLAEDFTVYSTTTLHEIEVYGYQTGSTTTSTFTGLYVQIYDGNPAEESSNVVWGDMETNIMTSTSFTHCYRGSDNTPTGMTRPIMAITASGLNIDLEAGNYWLVFNLTGTGSSGPWGVPYAKPTIGNTGEGMQYTTSSDSWNYVTDTGNGERYGFAMKLTFEDLETLDWTNVNNISDNEYQLTGLTPETTYLVQVRSACGGEDGNSVWVNTMFTTLSACQAPVGLAVSDLAYNAATLGWTGYQDSYNVRYRTAAGYEPVWEDDFESGLGEWTIIKGVGAETVSGQQSWYVIDPINGLGFESHSGSQVASSWSWNSIAYQANNWLISPLLDLQGVLRYFVRTSSGYPDSYEVLLSTTDSDTTSFTVTLLPFAPAPNNGIWNEVVIDLSAYEGEQGYIAFHHVDYDMNYLVIDDFGIYELVEAGEWNSATVTELTHSINGLTAETDYEWQVQGINPSCEGGLTEWSEMAYFTTLERCPAPTGLAVVEKTGHSATLTWVEGSDATLWEIAYGKVAGGFDPDEIDDIELGEEEEVVVVTADEIPFTIDLTFSASTYYAYVRSICGTDAIGRWSNVLTFQTEVVCFPVDSLEVSDITAESAFLTWVPNGDEMAWDIQWREYSTSTVWEEYEEDGTFYDPEFEIYGLQPGTIYQVRVRASCDPSTYDLSPWTTVYFATPYALPYFEDFDEQEVTSDWVTAKGIMDSVLVHGYQSFTSFTSAWAIGNTQRAYWGIDNGNYLYIDLWSYGKYEWAVTPNIELTDNCELGFKLARNSYYGVDSLDNRGVDDRFAVLVTTDDGLTWELLRLWDNNDTTNTEVFNAIGYVGEYVDPINLSAYVGETVRIAFYAESTVSNADNYITVDDISIDFNGPAIVDQEVNMLSGWTWFSTYVEYSPDALSELATVLANEEGSPYLKNQTQYLELVDGVWDGSAGFTSLDNHTMYVLRVDEPIAIYFEGPEIQTENFVLTIYPGWNWIPYVLTTTQSVSDALAAFTPAENDMIKGQVSSSTYTLAEGWDGELTALEPGQGYMYYSAADESKELVYTNSRKTVEVIPTETFWNTDFHRFATNLSMMVTIDPTVYNLREGNYEIGAFVNGECRGTARLKSSNGNYIAFLTVTGDNGEEVSFRLYDVYRNEVSGSAEETITYVSDAIIGNAKEPMMLHFGNTALDDHNGLVQLFPNPANEKTFINGYNIQTVKVYNSLGQQVLAEEYDNASQVELNLSSLSAGVYTVSVRSNGQMINTMVVKQ